MRNHRTIAVLFLATTSWAAIACTAGSGPLASFDDPYDRPPDSREKPGDGRDTPPGAIDNPGSQGPGPNGGANNCPPCDGVFRCSATVGNQTVSSTNTLVSNNGACNVLDSKGKVDGSLLCGGQISSEDANGATWTSNGADSFTVSGPGKVNGQQVTITTTCTRSQGGTSTPSNPPGEGGEDTEDTPSPAPIVDAGIKG